MVKVNFIGAIAAVVIIIIAMTAVSFLRKQIEGSGSQTAITLMRVGDAIVLFRFIGGLVFMALFIAIALAAGAMNDR